MQQRTTVRAITGDELEGNEEENTATHYCLSYHRARTSGGGFFHMLDHIVVLGINDPHSNKR